jgi:DNA-binding HxlR family transcriptional regulator
MCSGDRWTVTVVAVLYAHCRNRYREIFKRVEGVSQRMLTVTLRNLERDGLVTQTMRPTIPPKVEYELSERGQSLVAPLRALWFWVRDNRADIERSRKDFELRVVN